MNKFDAFSSEDEEELSSSSDEDDQLFLKRNSQSTKQRGRGGLRGGLRERPSTNRSRIATEMKEEKSPDILKQEDSKKDTPLMKEE